MTKKLKDIVKIPEPEEIDPDDDNPTGRDHWCYHLMCDISGCNENIDNEKEIRAFFKELIKKLDMKAWGPLHFERIEHFSRPGVSAVQIIITSSITFHGDNNGGCIYLDVFTCKAFDPKLVPPVLEKYFAPEHMKTKWFYRDAGPWPR